MHTHARSLLDPSRARARAGIVLVTLLGALVVAEGATATGAITITFEGGTFDPSPPPGQSSTPAVYEAGALYEGFWFDDAGTPAAVHNVGHTHILWDDGVSSLVDKPHSWRNGLQGARISLLDGSAFRLVSIDYRVRERLPSDGEDPNAQLARLPWSHPWQDVHLLLSEDVDPVTPDFATFEAQWSAFSIDPGTELDLGGGSTDPSRPAADDPWRTFAVTGFDAVTSIYVGHTGALVQLDSIVIEPLAGGGGDAVPQPGTGLLVGAGLVVLGTVQRRPSRRRGASASTRSRATSGVSGDPPVP